MEPINNNSGILELKFEGNLINPEIVHPKEIAELINSFTDTLIATIKEHHPEINENELLFTFHDLDDKSLDLKFKIRSAKEVVLSSFALITTSINDADFNNLNNEAIEGLKNITRFSKKYNCNGSFRYNNVSLSEFNPSTEIKYEKRNEIRGETVIHGMVLRVGGETPTIHFKVNNEYRIIFDTKEVIAKRLAQKLYEEVRLIGIAKWNRYSYKITDFNVIDILETEEKPITDTFNELRNLIGKHWDNVDNIKSIID